jgi:hypothetical protein
MLVGAFSLGIGPLLLMAALPFGPLTVSRDDCRSFRAGIINSRSRLATPVRSKIPSTSAVSANSRSKTMQIQASTTMVPLLVTILVSAAVQAIGAPSADVALTATTTSSRTNLAVLQAPIGHRQPTLNDLPEWLRDRETPGIEGSKPTQDQDAGSANVQQRGRHHEPRRTPSVRPNGDVPSICEPC